MNKFENAKFGDKFRTRDGRMAVLWYYHVGMGIIDQMVFITTEANKLLVDGKGASHHNTDDDIVGKWEEPINDEELDKLAMKYRLSVDGSFRINELMREAFKMGYRKGKEE